ncbi:MAG: hypothetical protein ABJF04_21130 [Reichenbachiella sp.]|uniref:hypothetical protein n=1 Tax=Reichenbachiella sp. TaxID=2184521 RepID=UPI0032653A02
MIKNIIIGVLSLLIIFFAVFAKIKADEAEKQTMSAKVNLEYAQKNLDMAKADQQQVLEVAVQASKRVKELEQQLEECK